MTAPAGAAENKLEKGCGKKRSDPLFPRETMQNRTRPEGLTAQEVQERIRRGETNAVKESAGKSTAQILLGNIFTYFNMLNAALAVCLALVGSWRNMLFMGTVLTNTAVAIVQELRARAMLSKLSILDAPRCRVRRDGTETEIPSAEAVKDDLCRLFAGDQVPADGFVVSGFCAADESLLTGESEPVEKHEGDRLMSGSYVTEGEAVIQLTDVGENSYAARLNHTARTIVQPKSVLMRDLNRLLRFVSVLLVPLGVLQLCRQVFADGKALPDVVPTVVASMVAMIPEVLIVLTSLALVAGVITLGRRKVLVQ